jgi:hypothetical protein
LLLCVSARNHPEKTIGVVSTTTPKTPLNLRFSSALDEPYNYSDITISELAKVGAVKICEYKLDGC